MTSKITIKKSSVVAKVPLVGDLDFGELALNYADGALWYKTSGALIQRLNPRIDASNNIVPITTNTQTLGTGTLLWNNVYATTFTGALSGNATTATSVGSLTGIATVAPLIAGTAAVGTSTLGARQDHVHPVQTSVSGNAGTVTAVTASNFASQTANTVLAAPDGAAGIPTFRNLLLTDLPDAWVKRSCGCATTAALTINTAQTTIDGVTISAATRVLVKDQAAPAQNGIYTNVTTTTWVRTPDADTAAEIAGAFVNIDAGTVNGGKVFDCDLKSTDTLGTAAMGWSQNVDVGYFTTVGNKFATLTNPSAITFPRINADNTVSTLDAATFRTAIGAGTSSTTGTVTSVGGTGTVSGLTLTGTVTTTGNLTLGGALAVTASNFASQTANTFLSAPNGAAGVPTFRAIVAADVPTLNQNTTGSAGSTPTVLVDNSITYGRSGLQFVQISGVAGDVATTTNTPTADWWHIIRGNHGNVAGFYTDLALPMTAATNIRYRRISAGVSSGWITVWDSTNLTNLNQLTNGPGYTTNTGTVTGVTGTAPVVSSGGTAPAISMAAATASVDGYMTAVFATKLNGIAAGATANTGTVTSVGGTGTVSGLTLSGTVTTTGNLTLGGTLSVTASSFASQTANTVLAAPNSAAGVPTFRNLSLEDLPDSWAKKSVRAGTTANITLSAPQTIDGIAVVAGDRVLVKDQTTQSTNGIYVVAAGTWTRALDADTISELAGAHVNVDSGTVNGGLLFDTDLKSTDTLGTTAVNFYRIFDSNSAASTNTASTLVIRDASGNFAAGAITLGSGTGGSITGLASLTVSGNIQATSYNGGQLAGLRNNIINGNMGIFQRGTAAVTVSSSYGPPDRWLVDVVGDTFSTTQGSFVSGDTLYDTGGAQYYTTIAVTSVANVANFCNWGQKIEDVRILAGKTVTVSFWAKAAAGTPTIGVMLLQNFGLGGAPSANVEVAGQAQVLSTTWTKYTKTFSIPSINGKTLGTTVNTGFTRLNFYLDAGSNLNTAAGTIGQASKTVSIAQVQLEIGAVATPFEFRPIGMELALCQRYYQIIEAGAVRVTTYSLGPSSVLIPLGSLPVEMRATPTIVQPTFTYTNASAAAVSVVGTSFARVSWSATTTSTTSISTTTRTTLSSEL